MTGLLLFGPPGTGKTLVVRALAREAGTRMLAIAPSDVMDMYVGEGEKLVRAVFALARRLAPCIVFLDELDALFGARSGHRDSGGAAAHRGVLTEFMQEMDGLRSAAAGQGVVVIGATYKTATVADAYVNSGALDLPHPALYTLAHVSIWALYTFIVGLFATGLWVVAHECGHQAFSTSKTVNNTVGWFLHSGCVLPVNFHRDASCM